MNQFRFAIMGAGHIAAHFCDAVARMDDCRVVAVASKSLQKAETFAKDNGVPAFYDSYQAMLENEAIDCVYVAATTNQHYDLCQLCIEHGVPVLCEKAMTTDSAKAKALFDAAEAKGVFIMEGMWSCFLPANLKAKQWLREMRIGKPVYSESVAGFVAPDDPLNRYFNRDLGGGASFDVTVYTYEILCWMMEKYPERVKLEITKSETGVDTMDFALMRFEGGLTSVIETGFLAPMDDRLVISGQSGRIVVPHHHYANEAILYDAEGREVEHFHDYTPNGFVYEIGEVMRCVREGRIQSETASHALTLSCAALFDEINAF